MDTIIATQQEIVSFTNWPVFLFATFTIFLAALVQGMTGLGFGMIAAPILMILNPNFVPGPLLALAMTISLLIALRERHSISWGGMSIALGGRIVGTVFAIITLATIPLHLYGLIFGGLVLLAVTLSVSGWRPQPTLMNLVSAGLCSGYMGTLTSIGAPPLAIIYQNEPGQIIRSTLATFFAIGAALSLIMLSYVHQFSFKHAFISLVFLPTLLAGFWASGHLVPKIQGRIVRYSVLSLSALSAIALIVKSLIVGEF